MAVPKRKMSRSNTRSRRSQWKAVAPTLVTCPNRACGEKKLFYETYQDSIELKGDKLGQTRHFIAVYLTGYGYEKKLLGKGEGKNKVEAGNWAAIEAMYGDSKDLVDECERISKTETHRDTFSTTLQRPWSSAELDQSSRHVRSFCRARPRRAVEALQENTTKVPDVAQDLDRPACSFSSSLERGLWLCGLSILVVREQGRSHIWRCLQRCGCIGKPQV